MSSQFDIIAGLDISSLSSVSQSQMMQAINQLAPISNIGFVIYMAGASGGAAGVGFPDIIGNPRFVRYLWIDTQSAGNPVIKRYVGTVPSNLYTDWAVVGVANNAIITSMILDGQITKAKMTSSGGTNGYLLQVNNTGGYDFVSFLSLFGTGPIVPLSALNANSAVNGQFMVYNSGWGPSTFDLALALSNSTIDPAKISGSGIITPGALLKSVGGGTPSWVAQSATSTLIENGSLSLSKLSRLGGGVNGQVIRDNGTALEYATPIFSKSITLVDTNPIILITVLTHSLGVIPKLVVLRIVCVVNEPGLGYVVGDEIDIFNIIDSSSPGFARACYYYCDSATIKIRLFSGANAPEIPSKDLAFALKLGAGWTAASWRYKLYLFA